MFSKFKDYLKYKLLVHRLIKANHLTQKQVYLMLVDYGVQLNKTMTSVNKLNHFQRVNQANMSRAVSELDQFYRLSPVDRKIRFGSISKIASNNHVARSSLYREYKSYKQDDSPRP